MMYELTPREYEVLALRGEGKTYKEIGQAVGGVSVTRAIDIYKKARWKCLRYKNYVDTWRPYPAEEQPHNLMPEPVIPPMKKPRKPSVFKKSYVSIDGEIVTVTGAPLKKVNAMLKLLKRLKPERTT